MRGRAWHGAAHSDESARVGVGVERCGCPQRFGECCWGAGGGQGFVGAASVVSWVCARDDGLCPSAWGGISPSAVSVGRRTAPWEHKKGGVGVHAGGPRHEGVGRFCALGFSQRILTALCLSRRSHSTHSLPQRSRSAQRLHKRDHSVQHLPQRPHSAQCRPTRSLNAPCLCKNTQWGLWEGLWRRWALCACWGRPHSRPSHCTNGPTHAPPALTASFASQCLPTVPNTSSTIRGWGFCLVWVWCVGGGLWLGAEEGGGQSDDMCCMDWRVGGGEAGHDQVRSGACLNFSPRWPFSPQDFSALLSWALALALSLCGTGDARLLLVV